MSIAVLEICFIPTTDSCASTIIEVCIFYNIKFLISNKCLFFYDFVLQPFYKLTFLLQSFNPFSKHIFIVDAKNFIFILDEKQFLNEKIISINYCTPPTKLFPYKIFRKVFQC